MIWQQKGKLYTHIHIQTHKCGRSADGTTTAIKNHYTNKNNNTNKANERNKKCQKDFYWFFMLLLTDRHYTNRLWVITTVQTLCNNAPPHRLTTVPFGWSAVDPLPLHRRCWGIDWPSAADRRPTQQVFFWLPCNKCNCVDASLCCACDNVAMRRFYRFNVTTPDIMMNGAWACCSFCGK